MIAQTLIPAVATLGAEFYVGHRLGVEPKTLAKILLSGLAASIVVSMIVIAITPSTTRVAP